MAPVRGDVRTFVVEEIVFASMAVRDATLAHFGSLRHGMRCTWDRTPPGGTSGWQNCFPDVPNLSIICRSLDCFAFVGPSSLVQPPETDHAADTDAAADTGIELIAAIVMCCLGGCMCFTGWCVSLYHLRHSFFKLYKIVMDMHTNQQ